MSEKIAEIRKKSGLSRAAFSRLYHIPIKTMEHWEWGQMRCPNYVVELLERAVTEDLAAGKFENPEPKTRTRKSQESRLSKS